MSAERIPVPEDLLHLPSSDLLESVSMSKLARTGTAVLQRIMSTDQPVAVEVQGQGAMVTLTRHQYDEMIELIRRLKEEQQEDGFNRVLSERFDGLVADMGRPGASTATEAALFGNPLSLNQAYRPGSTEKAD
ncbi:MAG: hypothetical protein ACPG4N_00160 [Gammaproteobacteria bacterium]